MRVLRWVAFVMVVLAASGWNSALVSAASSRVKWLDYTDQNRLYSLRVPSSWEVLSKGNAVVIASREDPAQRGVFGITLRPGGKTVEEAVEQEFQAKDRPTDLVKSPARIAGAPAVKVVGSKKGDPATRVVEYYAQNGDHQYYLLLQAPRDRWNQYNAIFYIMIRSFKFME